MNKNPIKIILAQSLVTHSNTTRDSIIKQVLIRCRVTSRHSIQDSIDHRTVQLDKYYLVIKQHIGIDNEQDTNKR